MFCQIVAGEIPSYRVAESAAALAFLDAFPAARGHCLVAAKGHFERVQDVPPREAADMMQLAARAVSILEEKLGCDTLVALHNGKGAGQEIPHAHMHLIPRRPGDGASAVTSMFPGPEKLAEGEALELARLLGGAPAGGPA